MFLLDRADFYQFYLIQEKTAVIEVTPATPRSRSISDPSLWFHLLHGAHDPPLLRRIRFFTEIRKDPRTRGQALVAVFHSSLTIFSQKAAWALWPLSSRPLSPSVYTCTPARMHTPSLENKEQGAESLPALPSRSHRDSQDYVLWEWEPESPAIQAGMGSHCSSPQQFPRCQGTASLWNSSSVQVFCRPANLVNIY